MSHLQAKSTANWNDKRCSKPELFWSETQNISLIRKYRWQCLRTNTTRKFLSLIGHLRHSPNASESWLTTYVNTKPLKKFPADKHTRSFLACTCSRSPDSVPKKVSEIFRYRFSRWLRITLGIRRWKRTWISWRREKQESLSSKCWFAQF